MIISPWSYSSLSTFVQCPRKFYETRIAKSVREPESAEMARGAWVHKQFENRQRDGTPLPAELAMHEPYMQRIGDKPGRKETERKIGLNRGLSPCGFFAKDVWWRGVVDFSRTSGTQMKVVDYKTGNPAHVKEAQLILFGLYGMAEGFEIIDTEFYWTKTKTTTRRVYGIAQRDELWAQFAPNLSQYVQAFKTDMWQPRQSGLCGWCPVTSCEFWFDHKEGKRRR
jgi:hypothetical protein